MPMKRLQMANIEDVLTPEAVHAIVAKEALLRAGITPSGGVLISSSAPRCYVINAQGWSDSATIYFFRSAEDDHARLTMFASESVLRRDWDSPEEDEAWAHL